MAGMTKLQMVSNSGQSGSNNYLLGDTTARVSPTTDKCVCSSDDVPVEEPSSPHLTGYEGPAKDADEEANEVQTHGILRSTCKRGWDGTHEQQGSESLARTNLIAHGTSKCSYEQRRCQRNDVGVCDLIRGQVHILLDTDTQL